MKLVILLSVLAVVAYGYPATKGKESHGTPSESVVPTETPSFSSFSTKSHFTFPKYFESSYPSTPYTSLPYTAYYNYNPLTFPYDNTYNYKPLSTGLGLPSLPDIFPPSGSIVPPIIGGGGGGLVPQFPPQIIPPGLLPPSLPKPPIDIPRVSEFSSQLYPYYNPFFKYSYSKSPFSSYSYSFPSFASFSSPYFGKKELSKDAEPSATYGPPVEPTEATSPAGTSDDEPPVSYPYEAAAPEGSASETPEPVAYTPAQEYGPPPSKK